MKRQRRRSTPGSRAPTGRSRFVVVDALAQREADAEHEREVDDQQRVVDEAELDQHVVHSRGARIYYSGLRAADRFPARGEQTADVVSSCMFHSRRCDAARLRNSSQGRDGRRHRAGARPVVARRGRLRGRVCHLSRATRRRARGRACGHGPGALPEYPRHATSPGDPTITDPQLIQIQAQTRPAGAAWRDPFRNAQDLYRFTTLHLPKSRAEQIKDADYWAVTSYLLAAQGLSLPPGGLGPANAATIPIPQALTRGPRPREAPGRLCRTAPFFIS